MRAHGKHCFQVSVLFLRLRGLAPVRSDLKIKTLHIQRADMYFLLRFSLVHRNCYYRSNSVRYNYLRV